MHRQHAHPSKGMRHAQRRSTLVCSRPELVPAVRIDAALAIALAARPLCPARIFGTSIPRSKPPLSVAATSDATISAIAAALPVAWLLLVH
jgi:hypothetical protein